MKYYIFTISKHSKATSLTLIKNKCDENHFIEDENNPDIVFVVGGDGTFLRAVNKYINKLDNIKFVGIKEGTLGFFYDYNSSQVDQLFDDIKSNNIDVKTISLINAKAEYTNEIVNIYAVNEVRIENPFHTLISDVYINNEKLETFRGNGLVICSSIGSSAYNKSLKGAVVIPSNNILQITEIAAIQNNSYRSLGSSLIVNGKDNIYLKGEFNNVVIGYDYDIINKENLKGLEVTLSDKKVSIIYNKNYSYIRKLKESFIS